VLRELLEHTQLARQLGIWAGPGQPVARYEPFGGLTSHWKIRPPGRSSS
jgi:hypothetical protein